MRWILGLFIPAGLFSYIYMFTDMGDVFRTGDGAVYELISNTGQTDGVSLVFRTDNEAYMLTGSGLILRTGDGCVSWQVVSSLPVSDAVDMGYSGGLYFVVTSSGDVYRGSDVTSMSPVSSIGASGVVSLAGDGSYLYVLDSCGDVWRSSDNGLSWEHVGTTGMVGMVAIESGVRSLYAMDNAGDLFESSDNGVTWSMVSTVSQVGVVDMDVTSEGYTLVVLGTGELVKRVGKGWQYMGTASQVGVQGIGVTPTATFVGGGGGREERFRIYGNVIREVLRLESGAGVVEILNAAGERVRVVRKGAGYMEVGVQGLSPGIYFVRGFGRVYRVIKM